MDMVDSMFSIASKIQFSAEEENIRLQNLQRLISDEVRNHVAQEAMAKRLSKALEEAFEQSLDENKDTLKTFIEKL